MWFKMNINRPIFGKIAEKSIAYLLLALFAQIVPPASLDYFTLLFLITVTIILVSYSCALLKDSVKAYFLYTLSSAMFILLFGLRFWKTSIGLPLLPLASVLLSLAMALVVPFVARNLSDFVYEIEQGSFTALLAIGLFVLLIAVVIFVSAPPVILFKEDRLLYVVLGGVMCSVAVMFTHINVHLFAKGVLGQWMRMEW